MIGVGVADTLREVIFARRNLLIFYQFSKISSRKLSQGQSFAKINYRKKNSEIARFAKNMFLDCDIGPNEDDLMQNV